MREAPRRAGGNELTVHPRAVPAPGQVLDRMRVIRPANEGVLRAHRAVEVERDLDVAAAPDRPLQQGRRPEIEPRAHIEPAHKKEARTRVLGRCWHRARRRLAIDLKRGSKARELAEVL